MAYERKITFVFGIYRSGTTLVSRLFNGDNRFCSASDPIRPFFNAYTNSIRSSQGGNESLFTPFKDGFGDNPNYYQALLHSSFNESIDSTRIQEINREVVNQSAAYCRRFSSYLSRDAETTRLSTWKDLLNHYIQSITEAHQQSANTHIVIKEVWALEAALPLFNLYKDKIKVIIILRDPADILASSKANAGNYPLLYMMRQWRKCIALTGLLRKKYKEQVHVVQYEELCRKPCETYNAMANSILGSYGLDNDSYMPIAKDDDGSNFIKNSSYTVDTNTNKVDTNSIGRYRAILEPSELEWVKYLTKVSFLGDLYFDSLSLAKETDCEPASPYPLAHHERVADWFVNAYPFFNDDRYIQQQISLERDRFQSIGKATTGELSIDKYINNIVGQI